MIISSCSDDTYVPQPEPYRRVTCLNTQMSHKRFIRHCSQCVFGVAV